MTLSTGPAQRPVTLSAGTLTKLGLSGGHHGTGGGRCFGGQTLTIGATGDGTADQHHLRFRHRANLDAQPAQCGKLAANNLQAAIDTTGVINDRHLQRCGFSDDRRDRRYGCGCRARRSTVWSLPARSVDPGLAASQGESGYAVQ